jgi:hypothetical protein
MFLPPGIYAKGHFGLILWRRGVVDEEKRNVR